jgi:hypothetical protein
MKKNIVAVTLFIITAFSPNAFAAESAKLPYLAGERFVVSTGYNTPPTHIKKDSYAIDFTENGCDAYGKYAVAAMSGTVTFASEFGYNGGYGTEVLVRDARNVTERYAHMIPGSIPISEGDLIPQGTIIGEIGNTGLVAGAACAAHPGTHIHFAMYTENADGTFAAYDPEPISGYTNIKAENWYVSDNALAATENNLAELLGILESLLGNSVTVVNTSSSAVTAVSVASSAAPVVSGSPKMLSIISPPPSSATAPTSDLSVSSSSISSSSISSLQITVSSSSVSTSITETISPVPIGSSSGGGAGPALGGGGVSVSVPSAPITATTTIDDPSNDTVEACTD